MIFVAVGRESTCGFFQVIYEMENVYNCIYVVCGSVLFGGSAGAVKNLKGCSMPGSVTIKRNCTAIIHFSAPLYFPKHMINCSTIMNSNLFRILHLSWRIARRLFVRKHLANGCKWFIALWIARGTWRSPWNKRAGNLTAQPSRLRCGAWRVLETSFRDVVALGDEKALTVPTNNVEKGCENIWSTCTCLCSRPH